MKLINKFEYKRADQIVGVWEREDGKRFFVYHYRGKKIAVFLAENMERFVQYANSALFPNVEPLYEIALGDPEIKDLEPMSKQSTMEHMALDFITNYEPIEIIEL